MAFNAALIWLLYSPFRSAEMEVAAAMLYLHKTLTYIWMRGSNGAVGRREMTGISGMVYMVRGYKPALSIHLSFSLLSFFSLKYRDVQGWQACPGFLTVCLRSH